MREVQEPKRYDLVDDGRQLVPGIDQHPNGDYWLRTDAQRYARARAVAALEAAVAIWNDSDWSHYGHFDPTGQAGRGCPACNAQSAGRAKLHALLATLRADGDEDAGPRPEQPGDREKIKALQERRATLRAESAASVTGRGE